MTSDDDKKRWQELARAAREAKASTLFAREQAAEALPELAEVGRRGAEAGRALRDVLEREEFQGLTLAESVELAAQILDGFGDEVGDEHA